MGFVTVFLPFNDIWSHVGIQEGGENEEEEDDDDDDDGDEEIENVEDLIDEAENYNMLTA